MRRSGGGGAAIRRAGRGRDRRVQAGGGHRRRPRWSREQSLATAVDFITSTGVDVFAPAIGNAHGMYQTGAQTRQPAGHRHRRGHRGPRRAPRRHWDEPRAVRGPHRPRLRQGEHLDGAQDPVDAVRLRLHDREPGQVRPAVAVRCATRAVMRDDPGAHPAVRERGQGMVSALIFDCDGVLADTERDGHRVAFNETFHQFGLPLEWSEEVYAREAQDRRRQGADGHRTHARVRRCQRSAGRSDEGRPPSWPSGTRLKTGHLHRHGRRRQAPDPAGHHVGSSARRRTPGGRLAVASTSAEPSVHAILRRQPGPERAARFDVVLAGRRRRQQEAGPGHLPAGAGEARGDRRRGAGHRGLAERPAGGRRPPVCAA